MPASTQNTTKSPDAFRSIGEAGKELGLPTHVIRFWETKFRQLSPVKRGDGRRLFRKQDMDALRALKALLHEQGMTIKGAQKLLNDQGVAAVLSGDARIGGASLSPERVEMVPAVTAENSVHRLQDTVRDAVESGVFTEAGEGSKDRLHTLLDELNDVKVRLDQALVRSAA